SQLPTDPHFAALLAGVEDALASAGYALVLSVVADADAEAETYRRMADDGRIDGVLLTDVRVDDPRVALVTELGLEAAGAGPSDRRSGLLGVAADERGPLARPARTLADLGHRRIGHVAGPATLVQANVRLEAWREALAAADLPSGPIV